MKKNTVSLREFKKSDLKTFFEQQQDDDGNFMAAFISRNPFDEKAFKKHWEKITNDETVFISTIMYKDKIAGNIVSFIMFGEREIGYYLGKDFWGKGIATEALNQFVSELTMRPLFARVAFDNIASQKVLEKCGFDKIGEDTSFSKFRNEDVTELIYKIN